jgi:uncharacterized membrane protein YeiB
MPPLSESSEDLAKKPPRLDGLDVARGIAFIGMVLVNYGVVMAFGSRNPSWVRSMLDACTGRAAALFVLLAGAGLSLMVLQAQQRNPEQGQRRARIVYLRRAIALLVGGYAFYPLWEGDILHYYGFYLALGALVVPLKSRWLLTIAVAAVAGFIAINLWWTPWRLADLFRPDFWSWAGQAKNLFYNGWHPLFPWFAFLVIGMTIGRLPLQRQGVQLLLVVVGAALAVAASCGSEFAIEALGDSDMPRYESERFIQLLGTSCVPPGPLYVLEATGTALSVIGISMLITRTPRLLWLPVARVGRLALTLYVAHVLVGLTAWEAMGGKEGRADLHEVFRWWISAVIIALVFASVWLRFFKRGPLEMLLRKVAS